MSTQSDICEEDLTSWPTSDPIEPIPSDGPLQVDAISSCDNIGYDPYDVEIIMGVPYWNIPKTDFVDDSDSDADSEETIELDEQEPIAIDSDEAGLWIDLPPNEFDELADMDELAFRSKNSSFQD
ncbi:hypothetical protein JTB14_010471 [Gonioctena quinquepunctata]|nr:hypothetical protein JTB14_010471 [Gonioctena quinquepunctata]